MQHDYSYQTSFQADQISWKVDNPVNSEDENNDNASTVHRLKLRNPITQGEMEILRTWFPKAAKTLACVLRKRPLELYR
jgi:hypothetical protein